MKIQLSGKQIIWAIVGVVVVGAGIFLFSGKKQNTAQNTAIVKRGDIIQEVSVTGRVKSKTAVDLGFEKSGRVAGVYAQVGEHINAGTLLAEVESSSARGSLMEAEARLAELKRGSRPEELAVKRAELAKYTQDLDNAYNGITDILNDAFTKADDALHAKTAGIFSGYKTSSYKYSFSVCDSQLAGNGETARQTTEIGFDTWRTELAGLPVNASQADLGKALASGSTHIDNVLSLLESIGRVLALDCTVSNTALDTYRANMNTARTNVTTALSNINAKKQSIATLELTVAKVKDELSLLEAGTASEVVQAQEARVLSARGELAKYRIVSPINGVVAKADIKEGETSAIGKNVFSVIADAAFEMEAYVPEADIAKVKTSDVARVTLDAYGSDVLFPGHVTAIDPAETIIDNVPTYKVTLHFDKDDARIKSGMTANIDIATDSRTNALSIPAHAVITRDGKKFVSVMNANGTSTETSVTVGLKGSDGSIEILTGLIEGAQVVTSPK